MLIIQKQPNNIPQVTMHPNKIINYEIVDTPLSHNFNFKLISGDFIAFLSPAGVSPVPQALTQLFSALLFSSPYFPSHGNFVHQAHSCGQRCLYCGVDQVSFSHPYEQCPLQQLGEEIPQQIVNLKKRYFNFTVQLTVTKNYFTLRCLALLLLEVLLRVGLYFMSW